MLPGGRLAARTSMPVLVFIPGDWGRVVMVDLVTLERGDS